MGLSDDDFDDVNGGAIRPLLAEGLYPAECVTHDSKVDPRWGEKLIFSWQVFLSGALQKNRSSILPRYYVVKRDERGKLIFGQTHGYRKDWIAANDGKRSLSWNRLPPSIFEKGLYLISVVTVQTDSAGDLPPALYYSRVGRIILGCCRFQRHRVRCKDEPEVGHGTTEVYERVQA